MTPDDLDLTCNITGIGWWLPHPVSCPQHNGKPLEPGWSLVSLNRPLTCSESYDDYTPIFMFMQHNIHLTWGDPKWPWTDFELHPPNFTSIQQYIFDPIWPQLTRSRHRVPKRPKPHHHSTIWLSSDVRSLRKGRNRKSMLLLGHSVYSYSLPVATWVSFVQSQCINETDDCARIRVGSFHGHKITNTQNI